MKRLLRSIPPQTVEERGARDASRSSHRASARSFRLIRLMSVGDGGLAWARFRAEERMFEATERDPRLIRWVCGGRVRTERRRRPAGGVSGGVGDRAEGGLDDGLGDGLRRRILPWTSASSLGRDAVDGGRESWCDRCPRRRLRDGGRKLEAAAASGDRRRGSWTSRGAVDDALDLDRVVGERRRMGGLHRRRLLVDGRIGGDLDREGARLGDDGGVTGGAGQRLAVAHIVYMQRKDCNWFNVCACALGYASTTVKGNVISVMR